MKGILSFFVTFPLQSSNRTPALTHTLLMLHTQVRTVADANGVDVTSSIAELENRARQVRVAHPRRMGMQPNWHSQIHTHTHTIHRHTHTHTIHRHTHTHKHTRTPAHTHAHTYAFAHAHTHTRMHTHTHTHM